MGSLRVKNKVNSDGKARIEGKKKFVCEEGFQDFCVGSILIANYILISPQFKNIDSNEIYRKLKLII